MNKHPFNDPVLGFSDRFNLMWITNAATILITLTIVFFSTYLPARFVMNLVERYKYDMWIQEGRDWQTSQINERYKKYGY